MTIDYIVPGSRQVLAQPSSMACWATCYAMMQAWRSGQRWKTVRDAIVPLGSPWLAIFDSNTGIPSNSGRAFETAVGLHREPRKNLNIEGWAELLRENGLIWVSGVVPGGVHDRILEGIRDDGNMTYMYIIDPDGGKRYPEALAAFLARYEGQARVEPFYDDYQVLHF